LNVLKGYGNFLRKYGASVKLHVPEIIPFISYFSCEDGDNSEFIIPGRKVTY
jgi:hypothetical protein